MRQSAGNEFLTRAGCFLFLAAARGVEVLIQMANLAQIAILLARMHQQTSRLIVYLQRYCVLAHSMVNKPNRMIFTEMKSAPKV